MTAPTTGGRGKSFVCDKVATSFVVNNIFYAKHNIIFCSQTKILFAPFVQNDILSCGQKYDPKGRPLPYKKDKTAYLSVSGLYGLLKLYAIDHVIVSDDIKRALVREIRRMHTLNMSFGIEL